jgi:SAM-dependent methyltransferase
MSSLIDQERYKREAEFHDKVFAEEGEDSSRAAADKFYAVTASSKNYFRNYLVSHCGKHVLEYGCGPHTHAILLTPKGAAVTGIDISPVAVAKRRDVALKHNLHPVYSCVMNAESLAFADASFDLVCGTGILHHLELDACLAEIRRVLKPGGSAVFVEPLGHNPLINLYRNMTPAMRSADEHPLVMSDFRMARKHFGRLETNYFHLTSLAAVPLRRFSWFPGFVRFLDGFDSMLFRLVPWMGRHAWAVVLVLAEPRPAEAS